MLKRRGSPAVPRATRQACSTTQRFRRLGWHTSRREWKASACTFILDGTVIGTATRRIPNTTIHWVLQSETVPDHVTNSADTADIYIAWVRVYRLG